MDHKLVLLACGGSTTIRALLTLAIPPLNNRKGQEEKGAGKVKSYRHAKPQWKKRTILPTPQAFASFGLSQDIRATCVHSTSSADAHVQEIPAANVSSTY